MGTTPLKMSQLVYLAILALGIQFTNVLQLANMSSVYRFLGAQSEYLPYLGLAAPISGLLIQPIIGQLSDETFTVYGRRRPYIFAWSLLAIIACLILPFISSLWLATIFMWTVSCSINGAIESLRALTGDIVPNTQKPVAFSLQTILAGAGAGLATILPYFFGQFFSLTTNTHTIPLSIKISFIIGAIVWGGSLYSMLTHIHEHLPMHQRLYLAMKQKYHRNHWQKFISITKKMVKNISHMPVVIKQFWIVQLSTWIGLYAMWLYFSVAISQHMYGVPSSPTLEAQPQYIALLEKGALKTNFYFSVYQCVSVVYALFLPYLAKYFSTRKIHGASLMIGALGLSIISLVSNNSVIIICMVAIGIMWGSIMTLPYAIVSTEIPYNKMGIYLGIFNISITLPQIVGGFILQPIYRYVFHYHAIHIILLSGILIFIGGVLSLFLKPAGHCKEKRALLENHG